MDPITPPLESKSTRRSFMVTATGVAVVLALLLVLNPFSGMLISSKISDKLAIWTGSVAELPLVPASVLNITKIDHQMPSAASQKVFAYRPYLHGSRDENIAASTSVRTGGVDVLFSGMFTDPETYVLENGEVILIPSRSAYAFLIEDLRAYVADEYGLNNRVLDLYPIVFYESSDPTRTLRIVPARKVSTTTAQTIETLSFEVVENDASNEYTNIKDLAWDIETQGRYEYPMYAVSSRNCVLNGTEIGEGECIRILDLLQSQNMYLRTEGYPCVLSSFQWREDVYTASLHTLMHDESRGRCNPKELLNRTVHLVPVYGRPSESDEFVREMFTVTKEVHPPLVESKGSPYVLAVLTDFAGIIAACPIEKEVGMGLEDSDCDIKDAALAPDGNALSYWTDLYEHHVRLADGRVKQYISQWITDTDTNKNGLMQPAFSSDGRNILHVVAEDPQYSFPEHYWYKYQSVYLNDQRLSTFLNAAQASDSFIDSLVFSPDGEHHAYRVANKKGYFAVIDGYRTETYKDISAIEFDAMANAVVYVFEQGSWRKIAVSTSGLLEAR